MRKNYSLILDTEVMHKVRLVAIAEERSTAAVVRMILTNHFRVHGDPVPLSEMDELPESLLRQFTPRPTKPAEIIMPVPKGNLVPPNVDVSDISAIWGDDD